jgi:hypothetical protein
VIMSLPASIPRTDPSIDGAHPLVRQRARTLGQ